MISNLMLISALFLSILASVAALNFLITQLIFMCFGRSKKKKQDSRSTEGNINGKINIQGEGSRRLESSNVGNVTMASSCDVGSCDAVAVHCEQRTTLGCEGHIATDSGDSAVVVYGSESEDEKVESHDGQANGVKLGGEGMVCTEDISVGDGGEGSGKDGAGKGDGIGNGFDDGESDGSNEGDGGNDGAEASGAGDYGECSRKDDTGKGDDIGNGFNDGGNDGSNEGDGGNDGAEASGAGDDGEGRGKNDTGKSEGIGNGFDDGGNDGSNEGDGGNNGAEASGAGNDGEGSGKDDTGKSEGIGNGFDDGGNDGSNEVDGGNDGAEASGAGDDGESSGKDGADDIGKDCAFDDGDDSNGGCGGNDVEDNDDNEDALYETSKRESKNSKHCGILSGQSMDHNDQDVDVANENADDKSIRSGDRIDDDDVNADNNQIDDIDDIRGVLNGGYDRNGNDSEKVDDTEHTCVISRPASCSSCNLRACQCNHVSNTRSNDENTVDAVCLQKQHIYFKLDVGVTKYKISDNCDDYHGGSGENLSDGKKLQDNSVQDGPPNQTPQTIPSFCENACYSKISTEKIASKCESRSCRITIEPNAIKNKGSVKFCSERQIACEDTIKLSTAIDNRCLATNTTTNNEGLFLNEKLNENLPKIVYKCETKARNIAIQVFEDSSTAFYSTSDSSGNSSTISCCFSSDYEYRRDFEATLSSSETSNCDERINARKSSELLGEATELDTTKYALQHIVNMECIEEIETDKDFRRKMASNSSIFGRFLSRIINFAQCCFSALYTDR